MFIDRDGKRQHLRDYQETSATLSYFIAVYFVYLGVAVSYGQFEEWGRLLNLVVVRDELKQQ